MLTRVKYIIILIVLLGWNVIDISTCIRYNNRWLTEKKKVEENTEPKGKKVFCCWTSFCWRTAVYTTTAWITYSFFYTKQIYQRSWLSHRRTEKNSVRCCRPYCIVQISIFVQCSIQQVVVVVVVLTLMYHFLLYFTYNAFKRKKEMRRIFFLDCVDGWEGWWSGR